MQLCISAGSNVSGIYTLQPDYRNGSYQFQFYYLRLIFSVVGTACYYLCLIVSVVGTDCAALYLAGSNVSGIYTLQPDYRNGSYQFQSYYLCLIFSVVGTACYYLCLIFSVVGTDCAALYLARSNVSGIYIPYSLITGMARISFKLTSFV